MKTERIQALFCWERTLHPVEYRFRRRRSNVIFFPQKRATFFFRSSLCKSLLSLIGDPHQRRFLGHGTLLLGNFPQCGWSTVHLVWAAGVQNNPRAFLFSVLYLVCSFPLFSSIQRKVCANANLLEVYAAGGECELFGFFKIVLAYLPSALGNN